MVFSSSSRHSSRAFYLFTPTNSSFRDFFRCSFEIFSCDFYQISSYPRISAEVFTVVSVVVPSSAIFPLSFQIYSLDSQRGSFKVYLKFLQEFLLGSYPIQQFFSWFLWKLFQSFQIFLLNFLVRFTRIYFLGFSRKLLLQLP